MRRRVARLAAGRWGAKRRVAFDTETTGTNVWTGARPFAVSVAWDSGETAYWECEVDLRTRVPKLPRGMLREVREVLCDPSAVKYAFNKKFDWLMLNAVGVDVPFDQIEEVSFMARAVNNLEFSYSLKPLAKKYLEVQDDDEAELKRAVATARRLARKLGYQVGEESEQDYWMPGTLLSAHEDEALAAGLVGGVCERYAVRDAERTLLLGMLYEEAMDEFQVKDTYDMEMKLLPVTLAMEMRGIRIDVERMERCRDECVAAVEKSLAHLRTVSGRADFNLNSPAQLAGLLFGADSAAGLPVKDRTKTGQPKTDAAALMPHKDNDVVRAVLSARANTQALKLFFSKYAKLAEEDAEGNVILHPGLKQWGTLTARYAGGEPNLQQVSDPNTTNSIAAEFVVDVRQVFVPRPGHVWYCPDYSQIEVVIFADVSGEPALCDAIRSGQDVHAVTAERVWGGEGNERGVEMARLILDTDDYGEAESALAECAYRITELEKRYDKKVARKRAKAVTFTKIFGGGPQALMHWIGVSRSEAVGILNAYDDAFPTMLRRMREIEERGKRDGSVRNSHGRLLQVDPWKAYCAINHIVQSDAADLMKRGMLRCHEYLRSIGSPGRILLTIHDELILEFRRGFEGLREKVVIGEIRRLMSDHGGVFGLPVTVNVERVDERWSNKTKVELLA